MLDEDAMGDIGNYCLTCPHTALMRCVFAFSSMRVVEISPASCLDMNMRMHVWPLPCYLSAGVVCLRTGQCSRTPFGWRAHGACGLRLVALVCLYGACGRVACGPKYCMRGLWPGGLWPKIYLLVGLVAVRLVAQNLAAAGVANSTCARYGHVLPNR